MRFRFFINAAALSVATATCASDLSELQSERVKAAEAILGLSLSAERSFATKEGRGESFTFGGTDKAAYFGASFDAKGRLATYIGSRTLRARPMKGPEISLDEAVDKTQKVAAKLGLNHLTLMRAATEAMAEGDSSGFVHRVLLVERSEGLLSPYGRVLALSLDIRDGQIHSFTARYDAAYDRGKLIVQQNRADDIAKSEAAKNGYFGSLENKGLQWEVKDRTLNSEGIYVLEKAWIIRVPRVDLASDFLTIIVSGSTGKVLGSYRSPRRS